MKTALLTWIALVFSVLAGDRTWTSDDGKQLVGELLRDTGEAVVLKVNGREFTVPLTRLSAEDREWLDSHRKEAEERKKEAASLAGSIKTYPKNESRGVTFHVYYPTTFSPEKTQPMLILFSPGGQGRGILQRFQDACENVGWIGVGCDTFRNGVPGSELDPLFAELLPIIEKTVPHDPQRLFMGGMSGGASRALQYTAKFDRPWKGVISCGGWLGKEFDLEYRKGMAVAWVNGDNDKGANSWLAKDTEVLAKCRCKTKLFAFPGGHEIGPPEVLTEAMRWAGENSR